MKIKLLLSTLLLSSFFNLFSQAYWQQRVEYLMDIDVNVATNQFTGSQTLKYFNNSSDTLDKVFFHLMFNAFQPESMMDVRSRTLPDPDKRVLDRIYHLKDDEIGYHKIQTLSQDGKKLKYEIEGTIMTVWLNKPIPPGTSTQFDMTFESQIPLQVRRSGRDNKEGIRYSMGQWFPKIAEYDHMGWHAYQYIGREIFGPWGDFDVKVTIDSSYVVAAGGVLQNPDQIGKGYSSAKPNTPKLTYHFKAENVHDFMWAADPEYAHDVIHLGEELEFHYFYKNDTLLDNWASLQSIMIKAFPFIEDNFGKYPYPVYNFIQGGDSGMEYPMGTLITGHRSYYSLVGVAVHEIIHSWYQMMLGTNESYYAWMDEGFTEYAENLTKDYLFKESKSLNPQQGNYKTYLRLVESGKEEPLSIHADYYDRSRTYYAAAYSKGSVFLRQLKYIMGEENFKKGLLSYYDQWKFKHPTDVDFLRVMERQSGLELDWYLDYWIKTTKTIDYGIRSVYSEQSGTNIQLEKLGKVPMPIDLKVVLKNGKEKNYHIPLSMMLGHKPLGKETVLLSNWPWVNPYYSFRIKEKLDDVASIEIDPGYFMAETDKSNNTYPLKSSTLEIIGVEKKINKFD